MILEKEKRKGKREKENCIDISDKEKKKEEKRGWNKERMNKH